MHRATTTEGTWLSVDVSAAGQWLVFDMLGHIYRMPAGGGRAESLTQNNGVAVNSHPRVSPDGRSIAFMSDRRGQGNLLDTDGSNPRPVFADANARAVTPAWTPDGRYAWCGASCAPSRATRPARTSTMRAARRTARASSTCTPTTTASTAVIVRCAATRLRSTWRTV